MLQILRNKAQSVVIQAMVVVIALVFIFWGVGANMMNNREAAVVVNDEEISFEEFQKEYERTYAGIKSQLGGNIPASLLENMGIKEQVVNKLIQSALLRQGAAKMGLSISPAEIQNTVEDMVQFQSNGGFDIEKYKSLLAANGFSPHKYEDTIRAEMLPQRVALDIQNFITTASDYEINDLNNLEKTTVSVDFVKISPDEYLESISPSNDELSSWFELTKENYKTLPLIKLKYISYSYDKVGKKLTIDDTAVKAYYTENISQYSTPAMRRARHILLKADDEAAASVHAEQRKKAENILELAKSGEDFSELAKKFSEGPSKAAGGDLGLFAKGRMVKPFDDAVFAMETGAISEIVKTDFGYHIIKLDEIQAEATKSQSEVHDEIVRILQTKEAKAKAQPLAKSAYEGIITAGSLKAYAEANPDTLIEQTDFFDRTTPPEAFKNDAMLLDKAFSLKEGELSSLIETANGYTILYAEAITPPAVPAFEDVKEKVLEDYIAEKSIEHAKKGAEEVLAKAQKSGELETAINEKQKMENSGLLSKKNASQTPNFPANLIEQAFQLTPDVPFPDEIIEVNKVFYVLQFSERKTPDTILTDKEISYYKEALLKFKQQKLLSSWLKQQEKNAKVMTSKNI